MLCAEEITRLSNEDLVHCLRSGEEAAAELLLARNEGYLSKLAAEISAQYKLPDIYEDLQQEGRIALLTAAASFDPARGVKFLSYAGAAVRSAMLRYAAKNSLVVSLPANRFHQLRKVAYICATAPVDHSQAQLLEGICIELNVSPKSAASLLRELDALYSSTTLGDDVFRINGGKDPALFHENRLKIQAVLNGLASLKPRAQNIVKYHLGLATPDGKGMTFEELAVRLNYNGPSGVEKAYKAALAQLRSNVYQSEYGTWLQAKATIREALKNSPDAER